MFDSVGKKYSRVKGLIVQGFNVSRSMLRVQCFAFKVQDLNPKSPLLKKERGLVDGIELVNNGTYSCLW